MRSAMSHSLPLPSVSSAHSWQRRGGGILFPSYFIFFFFLSQNHKRQETWQLARRTTKLQMQFREAEAVRSTVGGACTCDLGVALALAFGPRGAAMKTTALVAADMGQWMARVWGWTSAFPSKKEVKEG